MARCLSFVAREPDCVDLVARQASFHIADPAKLAFDFFIVFGYLLKIVVKFFQEDGSFLELLALEIGFLQLLFGVRRGCGSDAGFLREERSAAISSHRVLSQV